MSGTVLVTGISGFTGPYVRHALERRGYRVLGLGSAKPTRPEDAAIDLLDEAALGAYMKATRAQFIIHLAGIAFVAHDDAGALYRANLLGTLNLLDAATKAKWPLRKVLLASSANVYGRPAQNPVAESAPLAPLSHYAASKVAMEQMARVWFDRLPILITRPFNYTGVGQSVKFLISKLVSHFRLKTVELELGNTSVIREFMDVRDVAALYVRLLECSAVGEPVNICSTLGHRVDTVIERLRTLAGHDPKITYVESLKRDQEITELVGSSEHLQRRVGGLKFRPLDDTLEWMLRGS